MGLTIAVIVIASVAGVYAYTDLTQATTTGPPATNVAEITTSYSTTTAPYIYIENGSMSLCVGDCLYPSPHLSGTVFVNSTSPLKTLTLYINDTFENTAEYSNNFTNYAIDFKATPSNQSLPILTGKTYLILLVAEFQDGIQSTTSAIGIAFSNSPQTTTTQSQSYCCTDQNLNNMTPCSTILTPNYPSVQQLERLIETDPNFRAREGGLNYTSDGSLGCGFAINPGQFNGTTVDFTFTYTSNLVYTNNCGYVGNNTDYLRVKVPLTETGYNLSAIQITSFSSSEITVSCTSSYGTTENTTTTVTATPTT